MAGKKGENSKKAAGNAKKTEAAAQKAAVQDAAASRAEEDEWGKGAKSSAKKDAAEAKKAEAARKKAEKDALLKEEEATLKAAKPSGGPKTATKKTRGTLDLGALDDPPTAAASSSSADAAALNATGIDNALDALTLTSAGPATVERHPERRFKAAYAAFEARRLPELEAAGETRGLRRQQRIELVKREFDKSPENPFNQASARFDASKDEVRDIARREREGVEARLGGK
ncbi:MAG: hypothetical protein M1832_001047 [Thelocarpon impressellum]|nr:MAG: hypothetical protein M1832_001047 [Thelocarpon impressellum]